MHVLWFSHVLRHSRYTCCHKRMCCTDDGIQAGAVPEVGFTSPLKLHLHHPLKSDLHHPLKSDLHHPVKSDLHHPLRLICIIV